MAYLIGTDEAGYGPNLGPLVIAASLWQVPDAMLEGDLYEVLGPVVVNQPTCAPFQLAIADSKRLYRPGGDLAQLERGLLTPLAATQKRPATCRDLREMLCPATASPRDAPPWTHDGQITLPTSSAWTLDAELIERWQQALQSARVRLMTLRATVIEPEEFNLEVAQSNSKGALLSNRTLDLIASLLAGINGEPVRIVCDKHGGRNQYGPLLTPRFDDRLVRVICEGRQASVYDVGTPQQPIQISFRVGGEAFLPSALASMLAKYLRELSMLAFNAYWQRQLPELRPTAGYPLDAKRFWEQIRPLQQRLGIDDTVLWRCR